MKWIIIIFLFIISSISAEDPKPTTESLQARIKHLEQQIEQMQRAINLELRIRDGALQACREEALKDKK